MRYGLYVCWPIKTATTNTFEELIKLNTDSATYGKIPFINIFADSSDTNWRHACYNGTWCRARFQSQCEVEVGLDHFFSQLEAKAAKAKNKYLVEILLPEMRRELYSQACWDLIGAPDGLVQEAQGYMAHWRTVAFRQVGVHIRRGDLAYFNWRKKASETRDMEARQDNIKKWMAADPIADCDAAPFGRCYDAI